MITFLPMILKEEYFSEIEEEINRLFYEVIFEPLFRAFQSSGLELQNSGVSPAVQSALLSGRIWYDAGAFYGKFNAAISRELQAAGGVFDGRSSSWRLPVVPADIQIYIAAADARGSESYNAVIRTLDQVDIDPALQMSDLKPAYDRTLKRMNEDFRRITSQVAVQPVLTDRARRIIADEWAENLEIYVKDWAEESVLSMRQQITSNAMRGQRAENIERTIMHEYDVSRSKAKFLARQETSLLMSKFQEQRFADIGVHDYIWDGVDDERERHDHKLLNGTRQSFASPPVTNRQTGAKNNPGEDFGCRCLARGILEEV